MNKKFGLWIAMLLVNIICVLLFSTTVFAQEGKADKSGRELLPETIQTTAPNDMTQEVAAVDVTSPHVPAEDAEAAVPLTPDGNLTLVDDISGQTGEDKQYITVMTKTGKTFYIVIDRANEKQNVYFLNLVDEADLMALIDDKNSIGSGILKDKEVPTESVPTELVPAEVTPAAQPTKETNSSIEKPKPEQNGSTYMLVAVLVILLTIGGALWFVKSRKGKANVKRSAIFNEYDFEDDENETMDKENTPDAIKNLERQDGDRE